MIYTRGCPIQFILTAKSDKEGSSLFGYWIDEPGKVQPGEWIETDRSRILADGASNEVESTIKALPIVDRKTRR